MSKNTLHRALSFAMAAVMVLSVSPVSVNAAGGTAISLIAASGDDTHGNENLYSGIGEAVHQAIEAMETVLHRYWDATVTPVERIEEYVSSLEEDTFINTLIEFEDTNFLLQDLVDLDTLNDAERSALEAGAANYDRFWFALVDRAEKEELYGTYASSGSIEGLSITSSNSSGSVSTGGDAAAGTGTVTVSISAKGGLTSAKTAESTFTFKNTSGKTLQIAGKYTISEATAYKFNGNGSVAADSFSIKLADQASFTVYLKATGAAFYGSSTAMCAITELAIETVLESAQLSIDYNSSLGSLKNASGTVISPNTPVTVTSSGLTVTATPSTGSSFVAWVDPATGKFISSDVKHTFEPTAANMTVKALFSDGTPWFRLPDDTLVEGWDAAMAKGGTLILANNATLPAREKAYEVPSNVNLLIPFSDTDPGTFGAIPESSVLESTAAPTCFRTLTVAEGAQIVVNGKLNVNGQRNTATQGKVGTGIPKGGHGVIDLQGSGTQLTVNNTLTCYGFIKGTGGVVMSSGSKLYELLQLYDWGGGSNISSWYLGLGSNAAKTLFFTSHYYVQNVEAPLTVGYGSALYAETVLTVSGIQIRSTAQVLGTEQTENALFKLGSGTYMTRTYNAATDRVTYSALGNGNVNFGSLKVSVKVVVNVDLNSKDFTLPVNNAMTLCVGSGVNVTMGNRFALMPGTRLIIDGTLNQTAPMFIFDKNDKSGLFFDQLLAPAYTASRGTSSKITDVSESAQLVVNGTLNLTGNGGLYTTGGTSTDKIICGTGTINHSGKTDNGSLRGGYTGSYVNVTTKMAVANLAGDGDAQPITTATYQGLGPDHGNKWYISSETVTATCVDNAYTKYYCSSADSYYTIEDADTATGIHTDTTPLDGLCDVCGFQICTHSNTTVLEAVEETCIETGLTAGLQCADCGAVLTEQKEIPALGHSETDADSNHICDREGCTAAISTCKEKAEHTPAKAPTCTEKGNSAYWTCQTCGKFYSDADCTAEIAKDSWVIQINPDAHTFGQPQFTWNDYECSAKVVCDCNAEQSVDVTVTPEVTTTATCTVRGVKTYTATAVYNGETYTAEKQPTEDLGLNTDNHQNTTEHGQSNATCTENGYTAGTYCNDCKTWISGHEVIESNGHTYANPVVVFSQDGTTYTVKVTCSVCETAEKTSESKTSTVGETTPGDCQTNSTTIYTASGSYEGVSYSETKTVEGAKGDHSDANNDGNHTCDREGCTETVSNCEDKGKNHICDTDSACTVYSTGSNEHTPAAGSHDCAYCGQAITECEFTVQGDVKIPATCVTKAVYEAKCSVCGTVSETETIEGVVDPEAHNLMDIPAQTATCTQIGWNAYQKCQNEGCNYSTYVEIPMLEHDYADKWSSNGSGHWHACKNCTATIDATTHTEAEAVKENEIPPTYNTTGSYDSVVYCSVCNYEISRASVTEPMLQGVAKVGNTNYGTLADAVEAAEDGQTVTLLTDAELTERLTVKKKIVLDLSGKTITADFTDDFGAIYIGTSGDLTVTGNGTVLSVQDIIFANYGKITIENGTFKSEGETYNAALYNMYHSGDVYGTATIKGGNFETDVWNSGMLTVEDGTLEGIDNSGKTVITGGTVNGEILNGDGSDAPDLAEKGTIAISGGTFANAVDQTWCAEGYGPTDNGDGTYGVHLHTAGTAAKENVVAATCTTDGSYDTVVRCTQCYAVLSTQTTVVGKLNHEDPNNDGDHICDHEGCNAVVTTCGDSDKDHICDTDSACTAYSTGENAHGDGDDANHTCDYCSGTVEGEVCTDNNSDHKCDECGQTMSQCSDSDDTDHKCDTCGQDNITDHVYGEVTYTGDGINSYAAERSCACGHKQTATATITSAVIREATCTAEGETTYTADFAEDWAQDKTTTETIAKKPHTYGDLAWSWTGSDETGYTAATATFQCSCGDTQTETDDQLEKVTTDATYEAAGSDVYTAVVNFKDKAYTDTKTVTIAQLVKPTGYTVTLDDRSVISKGKATTTLDETKKYNAGDTFTVTCAEACVVAISTDNKETYEELSCVNVSGNTYQFTVPEDIDCDFWIGIALRGDATCNGAVDARDCVRISKYRMDTAELDPMEYLAADATISGKVDARDCVRISKFRMDTASIDWNLE